MAEKVSLLSSLPTVPVAEKSEETESKIVLLSSSAEKDAEQSSTADSGPTLNLLSSSSSNSSTSQSSSSSSPTSLKLLSSSGNSQSKKQETVKPAPAKPVETEAVESVASTPAAVSEESGGGGFGVVLVFGSFVLIFVLVAVGAALVTRKLSLAKQAGSATADVPPADSKPEPKSEAKAEAPVPAAAPEPAVQAQQAQAVDPVVEFINSTPDPQVASQPKKLPPRKPAANGANGEMPRPPKKPGVSVAKAAPKAPNAPSSIKAPSKPKKRF